MNENPKQVPLGTIISEIENLPPFRETRCPFCQGAMRVHALEIMGRCPKCGKEHKCRAFGGIGTELEDLIDAVLIWAGEGESFDAVMARRAQMLADSRSA